MSKATSVPKRGCIQIRLGDRKPYTFRDVDISSTSLMDIFETLFKIPRFTDTMNEIVDRVDKDINGVLKQRGGDVATNIGYYVVGNVTALNIATLLRINKVTDFDSIALLVKKMTMTDNAFLFNDDPAQGPVVRWRGHANLLFSNWLNYYVCPSPPSLCEGASLPGGTQ